VSINNRIRFEGTVSMPANRKLTLTRNFDLDTYGQAFGSEIEGFQAGAAGAVLLYRPCGAGSFGPQGRHDRAGLCGRGGGITSFITRRVVRNGSLNAIPGPGWDTETFTSVATYSAASPFTLTGVANVANIPVGALVVGTGVGREVYVKSKNVAAGTMEVSQPLFGSGGHADLHVPAVQVPSGLQRLQPAVAVRAGGYRVQLPWGECSGVMLSPVGATMRFVSCSFNRPLDRGISSIGTGCQGMFVDMCQFLSNEQALDVVDRTSIALNVQANDVKLRNNRVVRFAHFAVVNGTGHLIHANHFFPGR
jgi:hypothetical protein